jgi:hypothetical protein
MNDRQYVIRAAQLKGLAICKQTKQDKGILVHDWSSGFGRCIVDAVTWADARKQLIAAFVVR